MALAYYITDRHTSPRPILQAIQLAVECGIDLIQIREKDLTSRELFQLASQARELVKGASSRILINDRLDIAVAAGLDGVHLGQHSMRPSCIRAQFPQSDFLIGASVHSLEELRQVENQGVSFVTMGPVFFTPSKAAYGPPIGLGRLRDACQASKLPVLALGGVDLDNAAACLEAGAAGLAAIRLFQTAGDEMEQVIQRLHSLASAGQRGPSLPFIGQKRN